jgi:hypothetical protein
MFKKKRFFLSLTKLINHPQFIKLFVSFKLLNIPKLGHRKRLLNSLGMLKPKFSRNSSRHSVRSIPEIYSTCKDSITDVTNSRSNASTPTIRPKTVTFAEKILSEKDNKSLTDLIYHNCDTSNSSYEDEFKINSVEDSSLVKKQILNYSKYLKDFKTNNQIWKHDPQLLETTGCNYNVQVILQFVLFFHKIKFFN